MNRDDRDQMFHVMKRLQEIIKDQEEEIECLKTFGSGPTSSIEGLNSTAIGIAGPAKQVATSVTVGTDEIKTITSKIDEHAKVVERTLQAVHDHLEQYASSVESHIRSYASVAAEKPTTRPNTLQSVVITSKNKADTGEELLNKIRNGIEARTGWIKVERVRKTKDKKVILGFGSTQERDKAKKKLEERVSGLVVEEVRNKDPLVVLKGVMSDLTDEDIVSALRNQNRDLFDGLGHGDDRLSVKYRKKNRNPHIAHVILSTSPALWNRITGTGIVSIDLQMVRAQDQSPLVQCTRCLGYGHSRKYCKEKADHCSHCGGQHLSSGCTKRQGGVPPTCKNCSSAKLQKVDHNAFSENCIIRRRWDELARSSVAYS